MATLVKDDSSIDVNGKILYKPAVWVYILKYTIYTITLADLIYLLLTRYAGTITIVLGVILVLGCFMSYVVTTNMLYNKELISTVISVTHNKKDDKTLKIKFNNTELTKEKEVIVNNIKEIVAITNFLYIKLIDDNMQEVFEISLDSETDFMNFTHFVIEKTGAYLTSM